MTVPDFAAQARAAVERMARDLDATRAQLKRSGDKMVSIIQEQGEMWQAVADQRDAIRAERDRLSTELADAERERDTDNRLLTEKNTQLGRALSDLARERDERLQWEANCHRPEEPSDRLTVEERAFLAWCRSLIDPNGMLSGLLDIIDRLAPPVRR